MKKILIMVGMLIACSMAGTLKDNRDGKTYKTVKIGNQVWMAENLNYKTKESVCYGNKDANCKEYGRLYTWGGAQNACPAGWHLPTKEEWEILLKNVGGKETAGRALKSRHGWNDDGNGFDNYGFSALPAGHSYRIGSFESAGYFAYFWSASQFGSGSRYAYHVNLNYSFEGASMIYDDKGYGYSVRCLQNSNEERDASLVRPSEAGAANKQNQGSVKDSRDGKTYKTVKIGNQTWMAENLNYKTKESVCYGNKDANCKEYGRLYTWGGAQNACPAGWHLPTKEEWEILLKNVGGKETAGRALKSRHGWNDDGNGFDNYGFSALPAGFRNNLNDYFSDAGYYAYFWSASQIESNSFYAYRMYLYYNLEDARMNYVNKYYGFSVRCLQNSNEERDASLVRPSEAGAANKQNQGSVKDSRDGKTYKTVKIGNQTWMAENLNYKTKESVCYGNKDANCKEYGRLYTWGGAQNACPAGWHLPTKEEWEILLKNVGGKETAGRALKSRHGWNDDGNGFDNYGFSALPAGGRLSYGYFYYAGRNAYFWSASQYEGIGDDAYRMGLYYVDEFARMDYSSKNYGYSVRCLQNSNEEREASLVRPSEAGAANKQNQGSVKDSRDGKTYKTVKIGNQTWMAENLNYKTKESVCYGNKDANCKEYGRLYTWGGAQNACPAGWHLPTKEEWEILLKNVGGKETAGRALKSRHGWNDDGNGFDNYGFSALPAGSSYSNGYFYDAGYYAFFWSASQYDSDSDSAYYMRLYYNYGGAYMFNGNKYYGHSVRCLQNSNEERDASLVRPSEAGAANKQNQGSVKDSRDGKTYKTVKIGDQVWMAENLNVKTDEGSWCYENKPENCERYGRLYDWATAMDLPAFCNKTCEITVEYPHQGICPKGYHVPTREELETLMDAVGGSSVAGSKLKSTSDWSNRGDGTDVYGFSALPAGDGFSGDIFYDVADSAIFWSASGTFTHYAYTMGLGNGETGNVSYNARLRAFSIRCLKDSNPGNGDESSEEDSEE
ncbi:fibrobacter succinogenes major paralogous domain-containing protein [Fibrobacter sp. UWH1]|uniref:fibrobacter succinogenes major paralogous domain-containing protein n=1 Tax=Fibrobacter sp. UWH1 TaxID=1964354 RepID=UPI000B5233C6|nr:fibrobacter succinogenes major paralogous domain-containing protein [Fibrobacter sp. UWH1]OWV06235.1 hypothetical protein B7992_15065 [Fibrobacter sp. UWH1]